MSLADELLADLEILDNAGDEKDEAQWQNDDKMEVIDELQENDAISDKSVKSITKLLDSKEVRISRYPMSLVDTLPNAFLNLNNFKVEIFSLYQFGTSLVPKPLFSVFA